jgi:hypothetical protein
MRFVRRHRRSILIVLTLGALVAITLGYFRRIGCDPFAPTRPDAEHSQR